MLGAKRLGPIMVCMLGMAWLASAPAADIPYLSGRVVDDAEILSPAARDRLTAELKSHEQATGNQIAVLTVPTIGDESIEQYATRVFENWKLGQKGKDNGVLLIVAPKDRKMRIEVGYGLEGTLTDVAAARIIRNVMTPPFKAGDYDKGVGEGVAAIVATLEGRSGAATSAPAAEASGASSFRIETLDMHWPEKILFGAFVFSIIGIFTFVGIMTPGVGWFLYVFLIPFWAMFPMVIIGVRPTLYLLGVYLVGYPVAKVLLSRSEWYQKAATQLETTGHANIGGFLVSSAGGSSGFSSGGGGSGGFSGGGGSSGGGGASGSW